MCCYIWCSALGVVAVVLRSRCVVLSTVIKPYTQCTRLHTGSLRCGPKEPACSLGQTLHNTTHLLLRTTATTPYAVTYNLYSWRWAYRCPKHVQIFMIINHHRCIKLIHLVIFIFTCVCIIRTVYNLLPVVRLPYFSSAYSYFSVDMILLSTWAQLARKI